MGVKPQPLHQNDAYGCFINLLPHVSEINQSGYMYQPGKDQRQKTHIIQDDLIILSRRQSYWLNKSHATVSKRLHPESWHPVAPLAEDRTKYGSSA
jgi:hypothetical protein